MYIKCCPQQRRSFLITRTDDDDNSEIYHPTNERNCLVCQRGLSLSWQRFPPQRIIRNEHWSLSENACPFCVVIQVKSSFCYLFRKVSSKVQKILQVVNLKEMATQGIIKFVIKTYLIPNR